MIHLNSASIENDFYERKTNESESVKNAQDSIKNIYEMKKILIKRLIKKNDHENQKFNTKSND